MLIVIAFQGLNGKENFLSHVMFSVNFAQGILLERSEKSSFITSFLPLPSGITEIKSSLLHKVEEIIMDLKLVLRHKHTYTPLIFVILVSRKKVGKQ